MKTPIKLFFAFIAHILMLSCSDEQVQPNVVIIFLDDAGFGDMQPFASEEKQTPAIEAMAQEGVSYTRFYVPQGICSASRAALITGSYPGRTKVFAAHGPKERGLDTRFPTIGEIFQTAGYRTAIFGKWHCGDQPDTRPHERGFDESFGLMYSNDMWKYHPENPEYWGRFPIELWENGRVVVDEVDFEHQKQLTKWYTEHSVDFITRHRDEPFLLYVPHSMPHVPLFVSESFENKTGNGLYADVMAELDWSVAEINKALKENGIEENTIVILTSDNGPWTSYGNHSGTTPFREAKGTSFDGGNHSPLIIKYPSQLESGVTSDRAFFSIDLLPTLCNLAGIELPDSLELDGKNLWSFISGDQEAENSQPYYALSNGKRFEGIMSADGQWKLHLPHPYRHLVQEGNDGEAGKYETRQIEMSLYNLLDDPYERVNLVEDRPDVVSKLKEFARKHEERFYSE